MNARYQEEISLRQETIQIENAVRGCELDRQEMALVNKMWQSRGKQEVGKKRNKSGEMLVGRGGSATRYSLKEHPW